MNFKAAASYIVLLVTLLCGVLLWYGLNVAQRVSNIEELWLKYNAESTQSSYAISQINANFGYGGFIHNFKNYILHQDKSLIPVINHNLSNTYLAIQDYEELNITADEKLALKKLSHIVDIYSSKFEFAQKLVAKGNTPKEIEVNVQVNDTPAYEALEFLAKFAVDRSTQKEKETDKALRLTINILNWGALSIPIIILVGIIVTIFLKRIVESNRIIENVKRYSEDLIESAPDAWIIVNKSGKILRVNTQAENLFGYNRKDFINKPIEIIIPERLTAGHDKMLTGYFNNPRVRSIESQSGQLIAVNKDGKEFPVEISLAHTKKDNEVQAVAAVRDITKRKYLEERQQLTEQVFENAAEGIIILDHRLRILDINNALHHLMGYSNNELLGHTPRILFAKSSNRPNLKAIKIALQSKEKWKGELWLHPKDSEDLPVLTSISQVKSKLDNNSHYVVIFSDITQQKQQEEHLEYLAHYDSLTKLPNRMLFFDRFSGSLARARRLRKQVGIFYLDLDGFKAVNDTLGHQAGDDILVKTANILKNCIREDDTVARLGGDEFVILYNDIQDIDAIHIIAQRIISKLSFSITSEKNDLKVTSSIGISIYPRDGEDQESLLRLADEMMYEAKKMGKNSYFLYSSNVK